MVIGTGMPLLAIPTQPPGQMGGFALELIGKGQYRAALQDGGNYLVKVFGHQAVSGDLEPQGGLFSQEGLIDYRVLFPLEKPDSLAV
jgi:hypothetical protein